VDDQSDLVILVNTMVLIIFHIWLLLAITTTLGSPKLAYYEDRSLNTVEGGEGPGLVHTQLLIRPGERCGKRLYFLVMVHSAPHNFRERELIRETWGSVSYLQGWQVRVVFLLGLAGEDRSEERTQFQAGNSLKSRSLHSEDFVKDNPRASQFHRNESVNKLVMLESSLHGDIIQGNFTDSFQNLTTKHIMGYRWVEEHCPTPRFVLKADDDVFVEMFHLFNFVSAAFGSKPGPSLVCDVIPAGTSPHKTLKLGSRLRSKLFSRFYPKSCSGSAYLITPSLISRFLKATEQIPALWIDDVYMTGLVRERLGVSPFYLNLRYTYEQARARKWIGSKKRTPLPFIFVVSNHEDSDWPGLVRSLWRKSEDIQLDYQL